MNKEMTPEGKAAAYWQHRCKLAENVIESPNAYEAYKSFLAGGEIPKEAIRNDSVAVPSTTPEAVAVAYHFWADLNYTRVKTSVIPYGEYQARFGNDNRIYTASELFTMFKESPEYKELTK